MHITADFITKLPLAQGYNAILVVCDWLTKMAHFIPITEKMSAKGLARLFRDHVWKLHRLPCLKASCQIGGAVCGKFDKEVKSDTGN